jgi:hypothetical protein
MRGAPAQEGDRLTLARLVRTAFNYCSFKFSRYG